MSTICLAVMMRDESHVILEMLESVAPVVDCFLAIDTGSTDNTVEIVQDWSMEHQIPGEILRSEWVDFGTNRTELIQKAQGRADYIFMMDSDDVLYGTPDFSNLTEDSYLAKLGNNFSWTRKLVFKDGLPWYYEGVVHEYPTIDQATTEGILQGDYYVEAMSRGGRTKKGNKIASDIDLMWEALADSEGHPVLYTRYIFYIAQSFYDMGKWKEAIDWYSSRINNKDGWEEEIYYSHYKRALCWKHLVKNGTDKRFLSGFLDAYQYRPTRAEPLYELANYYRLAGEYEKGYLFADTASRIAFPSDRLFVSSDVYQWKILDELSLCAFYTGRLEQAAELMTRLLKIAPESEMPRIWDNLGYLPDTAPHPIVVVIPVKDKLPLTKSIVKQLQEAEGVEHVIILDNGSRGPTKTWLGKESDLCPTFLTAIDAKGKNIHEMWNMGIDEAYELYEAPHVAIFNNDIDLEPDALKNMSEALRKDKSLAAVSANYDNRELSGVQYTNQICAGRYDGTGGFAGFAFMGSHAWFSTYRFPEELTWWYGDNDLLMTLAQQEKKAGIVGNAHVVHLDGGSQTGTWEVTDPVLLKDGAKFRAKWRPNNMLWTIAMPTIPTRRDVRQKLLEKIYKQIDGYPDIEVLVLEDNWKRTLGGKFNAITNIANGVYVSFVDDDDDIADDYVDLIYPYLLTGTDCVSFKGTVHFDDDTERSVTYSINHRWEDLAEGHFRYPEKLQPIKRDLRLQLPYDEDGYGEDYRWTMKAAQMGLLRTERHVDASLYTYFAHTREHGTDTWE